MKPDTDAIKGALKSKYLDPRDNYLSDIRALLAHIESLEAKLVIAMVALSCRHPYIAYQKYEPCNECGPCIALKEIDKL